MRKVVLGAKNTSDLPRMPSFSRGDQPAPTGRRQPLTLEIYAGTSVGPGLNVSRPRGAASTLAGLAAIQVVRRMLVVQGCSEPRPPSYASAVGTEYWFMFKPMVEHERPWRPLSPAVKKAG